MLNLPEVDLLLVEHTDIEDAYFLLARGKKDPAVPYYIVGLPLYLPFLSPMFAGGDLRCLVTAEIRLRVGTPDGILPGEQHVGNGRYVFDSISPIVEALPHHPSIWHLFCHRYLDNGLITCIAPHPGHDPIVIHHYGAEAHRLLLEVAESVGVQVGAWASRK